MTIAANAILTRFNEVLDDGSGSTRTVPSTALSEGHRPWVGMSLSKPRFEVVLTSLGKHDSSPCSANANYRLDNLGVDVYLHHKLKSVIQIDQRNTIRYQALSHADLCMQALGFPGNLRATSAGTSTGIVSGMLIDLDRDIVYEEWDGKDKELVTQISGTAVVRISQAT